MHVMFYNPKLEPPKGRIYNIAEVDPDWAEVYARRPAGPHAPHPTYEEALNSPWTGPILFYRDGKMYKGSHVAADQYVPLIGVQCLPGINWDTWYACDPDELMTHLRKKYTHLEEVAPRYNEEFAVWSIQVHYDGQCR